MTTSKPTASGASTIAAAGLELDVAASSLNGTDTASQTRNGSRAPSLKDLKLAEGAPNHKRARREPQASCDLESQSKATDLLRRTEKKQSTPAANSTITATADCGGAAAVAAARTPTPTRAAADSNAPSLSLRSKHINPESLQHEAALPTRVSHESDPQSSAAPAPATIRGAWLEHYDVLRLFARRHGHARVAQRLDTAEYPKLGNWVANQRRAYRLERLRKSGQVVKGGGRINPEQIRLLEAIPGFEWIASNTAGRHKPRRSALSSTEASLRMHPASSSSSQTSSVSPTFQSRDHSHGNPRLRGGLSGIHHQSASSTSGSSVSSTSSASAMLPPPATILPGWLRNFASLQRFVKEHGHARVPVSLNTPEYPKLGSWVHVQRRAYRLEKLRKEGRQWKGNNRINKQQILMLESLGFDWAPASHKTDVFQCEHDCGFEGSFQSVKAHEGNCPRAHARGLKQPVHQRQPQQVHSYSGQHPLSHGMRQDHTRIQSYGGGPPPTHQGPVGAVQLSPFGHMMPYMQHHQQHQQHQQHQHQHQQQFLQHMGHQYTPQMPQQQQLLLFQHRQQQQQQQQLQQQQQQSRILQAQGNLVGTLTSPALYQTQQLQAAAQGAVSPRALPPPMPVGLAGAITLPPPSTSTAHPLTFNVNHLLHQQQQQQLQQQQQRAAKLFQCEFCGLNGPFSAIEQHELVCPKRPVFRPNRR